MLSRIRRSLRGKIVIVVLLTTFTALTLSALVLLWFEVTKHHEFLVDDATTQASILADISAPALAFDDDEAAHTYLELLSSRAGIRSAAVYRPDGELFATFAREEGAQFPPLDAAGMTIDGGILTVFRPVVQNEQVLGSVYLQASYDLQDRLLAYVLILGGVMLASLVVAAVISLWLAGNVTGPLREVTEVARHVIGERDFTLRARRTTEDEIGVFVDAFNAMLAEVGQRAQALEASNRALQEETEERRLAEAALRLADQRKDEFLATLAHELRNPLAPMVNAVGLLDAPGAGTAIVRRARGILRRQLAQMVRLVDDLLDVSRITRGKLIIRKHPTELTQIVRNAIDTARPVLDECQQTLTVELPDEPVYVEADSVRLAQVFSNLLNNSARYSERGKQIKLAARVLDGQVEVRIEDQGVGIAPETLPIIFEMFSQGGSIERTQSGLGVGLGLAKRLVELHSGTIEAHSEGIGQGSVFTVRLPVVPMPQATCTPVRPLTMATRRHRILLVDDNVDFATSLSLLLEAIGHQVRTAHDAAEALVVARELKPEVGFLDLGLPEVSGYDLARQLRAQPESAHTVLVAVSGWGQARDRERSREAGFSLHLVKPVELQSIQAALSTLVQSH
jgi:signal transduction histidine kinase/ActR/RegA family two-component response regulator